MRGLLTITPEFRLRMQRMLTPDQAELVDAVEAGAAIARETGKGRVIFVAGEFGSGRSFALRATGDALSRCDGLRVVTRQPDGQIGRLPVGAEPLPIDDLVSLAATGVSLLNPALSFISPLVRLSLPARRLVESLQADETEIQISDLFCRLLRAAAALEDKPLICLIDEADALDGTWWTSLQWIFGQEVHEERPLLLVFAIDGPAHLSAEPSENESAARAAARSLLGRGLAEWHGLDQVGQEEVVAWLGTVSKSVLKPALQISGGRAGELAGLWELWQREGAIQRDGESWRLANSRSVLAQISDDLSERLEDALGCCDRSRIEKLRLLLSCGALEGRTFTARAVADVFEWDHDEVIDLLDDLVGQRGAGRGILLDVGAIEVPDFTGDGKRVLWRYRFASHFDWRAARELLSTEVERKTMAGRLVEALSVAYAPDGQSIAHVLAELSQLSGDPEIAASWRATALTASQEIRRGCAKHLLGVDTSRWTPWDYRDAVWLLLEVGEYLLLTDSGSFLMAIAKRAEDFAQLAGDTAPGAETHAICLQGCLLRLTGDLGLARRRLMVARKMATPGAPILQARALTQLSSLERMRGNFDSARRLIEEADRIYSNEHPGGRATCAYLSGSVEYEAGNYAVAEEWAETGKRFLEKEALYGLWIALMRLFALITSARGEVEGGRLNALHALELARSVGYTNDEAHCHWALAVIELEQGAFRLALASASRAQEVTLQSEDLEGEARIALTKGRAAREAGELDTARVSLKRAAEIYSQFGNYGRVAAIDDELAAL